MSQTKRKEVSKAWTEMKKKKKNTYAYNDTDKDTHPSPFIPYITNLGFATLSGTELKLWLYKLNEQGTLFSNTVYITLPEC